MKVMSRHVKIIIKPHRPFLDILSHITAQKAGRLTNVVPYEHQAKIKVATVFLFDHL